ncbi:sensor histidine kinase [Tenggerimyces flavus]|uniref:Oxygen sensor histidine kinase NreB n=1 Tax=Tenggerimyces flavus TaxID=1708749 RepID=A0ABV7Y892_9ACTN|nr:sensor histidine kinase [Tenggerimyces flavus]MBM7783524.1 signal transduction histidine kinase [Tenggerimyces flavus]
MAESELDSWDRRLERLSAVIPYVMLGISLGIAWITASETPVRGSLVWTSVIAAAAGVWMFAWVGFDPTRIKPEFGGLFFFGLVVFYAVLQYRASVFGFFAFAGYIYALQVLKGKWGFVGVAVTGLISGNAIYGGAPPSTWQEAPMYLVVLAVTTMLACTFSFIGHISVRQSQQRKEMVVELEALNAKLKETMEENAGLHAQLLTQAREAGILDERQRMAREIHDTLAQSLTGIITQVQAAEGTQRPAEGQRHLDNAVRLARDALAEAQARRTVHAVRPEALETARLPEALSEVVERWSALNGVPAEVVTTGTPRPLHPEVEVTLLRVGQEALANVAKHAGASRAGLTLSYMEDVVTLDVRDNGSGFDLAGVEGRDPSATGGFGLHSMRQRVQRLTGSLAVESAPGEGTAISASVPAILPGGES